MMGMREDFPDLDEPVIKLTLFKANSITRGLCLASLTKEQPFLFEKTSKKSPLNLELDLD